MLLTTDIAPVEGHRIAGVAGASRPIDLSRGCHLGANGGGAHRLGASDGRGLGRREADVWGLAKDYV